jgi:hypothetical protein
MAKTVANFLIVAIEATDPGNAWSSGQSYREFGAHRGAVKHRFGALLLHI